jgi:hypothetical protein
MKREDSGSSIGLAASSALVSDRRVACCTNVAARLRMRFLALISRLGCALRLWQRSASDESASPNLLDNSRFSFLT